MLAWFVSQLTDRNFLIGLLNPIRLGGWFLPQFLVSGYLQRRERKLPLYSSVAVFRCLSWALLALVLFLVEERGLLLALFFPLFTLNSLGAGVAGLSFMDVVGKAIPARRRGSFFGYRNLLGGLLALGGSLVVRYVLDERRGWPFPDNYALLFSLSFLSLSLALTLFSLVVEPVEPVKRGQVSVIGQSRWALRALRQDANYRRFLLARLALVMADMAIPFYVVYAKRVFGVEQGMVGVFLTGAAVAGILSNLVWGPLNDRQGSRLVFLLSTSVGMMTPVLGLLALPLTRWLSRGGGLPSLVFLAIFALAKFYQMGGIIARLNYVLDIAPSQDRALYVGFANTAFGLALLASTVGGVIVDVAGFQALFAISLACYAFALALACKLEEPRSCLLARGSG